jgi:hypothetical protein
MPELETEAFKRIPRREEVLTVEDEPVHELDPDYQDISGGFKRIPKREVQEKRDPYIEGTLDEGTYTVSTYEHLKDWKEKGEIGLGEYHDRFHKWSSALPIISAAGVVVEQGSLLLKAERLAADDYGPEEAAQRLADFEEVSAFQLAMEEVEFRGTSIYSDILSGASESVAVAGELWLSGGTATAGKVAAKEALKKGVGSALKSFFKKHGAALLTKKGVASVAKKSTRAALVFAPRVESEKTRELLGESRIGTTDKGEVVMNQAKTTPATAYMKAIRGVAINALTELWGGRVLKAGAAQVTAKLPEKFTKAIVGLIPENKVAQFSKNILVGKVGVYDGLIAEIGEERLAGVLNVLLGGDDRETDRYGNKLSDFEKYMNAFLLVKDEEGNWGVDGRQALVELGIISLMGGTVKGASVTKRTLENAWRNRGMSEKGIDQMGSMLSETEKELAIEELLEDTPKPTAKDVESRMEMTAQIREAFPGAEVDSEGDNWGVTLPSGRRVRVRKTGPIPADIDVIMETYEVSEADAIEMASGGVAGVALPQGVTIEMTDGTSITADEITVLVDPKFSTDTTVRHEALHVAKELGLFDTKEGQKIWESLIDKHKNEEGIARAREVWEGPKSIWGKIREFFNQILSKLGADISPEAAMSRTFQKSFWNQTQKGEGKGGIRYSIAPRESNENLTSVRNEVASELRRERGAPDIEAVPPETQKQWLDEAQDTLSTDPSSGQRIVNDILSNPRVLSDREVAVLQLYYRAASNQFQNLSDGLFEAQSKGDDAKTAILQSQAEEQSGILMRIEEATKAAGREWGRAGVARQITLAKDFSLTGLVRKARVAQGGKPLTKKQHEEVADMSRKIESLEKRLEEAGDKVDALEREKALRESVDKEVKEVKASKKRKRTTKKERIESKKSDALSKIKEAWEKSGNKFVVKPKPKPDIKYQLSDDVSGSDSGEVQQDLYEAAKELSDAYIDDGVTTFDEFWAINRHHLGGNPTNAVASFRKAWDEVAAERGVERAVIDLSNPNEVSREAKEIQRRLVEVGFRDLGQIVNGVQNVMRVYDPNITRRQVADALSGYGRFSELTKDEISMVIRDINGQLQQLSKLEDMEAGHAPQKTGVERRKPSDEERMLIAQVNEAKRRGGFVTTSPEAQLKSALESAKTSVRNRISDLIWEIQNKERIVKEKSSLTADAELEALRKERDALMEIHREIFPKREQTDEQKIAAANRALDRAIDDLEKRLETGDISPKQKQEPVSTPELDAKRAKLAELRAQRDALRAAANPNLSPEEKARRSYEANLRRRIADYKERMARNEFQKEKKEPRKLSESELLLKRRLEDTKSEFYKKAAEYHLASLSPIERAVDIARETMHYSRALMTSFDLSAVFRQGSMVVYGHPKLGKEAAKAMGKAFVSRQAEFENTEAIKNDPLGQFAITSGLSITSDDGSVTSQEEAFMGRWARNGIEVAGKRIQVPGVGASGRAYTTFLNNVRFYLFKTMVDNLGKTGRVTLAEAKVISTYINAATGRANFKSLNKAAANLNLIFFAPRYVASRFQYLTMPFYLPFTKTSKRVKQAVAKEYARTLAGGALFIGSLLMAAELIRDDEEEVTMTFDPRTTDFGKIKIGETRIDPLGGLSQALVVSSRIATGETKSTMGNVRELADGEGFKPDTRWTVTGRFLRTKLGPIPGAVVTYLDDMTNVIGEKQTAPSLVGQLFVPLSFREVGDALEKRGIAKGTTLSLMALLGMGMGTYGPRTEYMDSTEEEKKKLFSNALKRVEWSDGPSPYQDQLTDEQILKYEQAKRVHAGRMYYYLTAEKPTLDKGEDPEKHKKNLEEWNKRAERAKDALQGFPKEDAVDVLIDYYKSRGFKGGSKSFRKRVSKIRGLK